MTRRISFQLLCLTLLVGGKSFAGDPNGLRLLPSSEPLYLGGRVELGLVKGTEFSKNITNSLGKNKLTTVSNLTLQINGVPMSGITLISAEASTVPEFDATLGFVLNRDSRSPANLQSWDTLFDTVAEDCAALARELRVPAPLARAAARAHLLRPLHARRLIRRLRGR